MSSGPYPAKKHLFLENKPNDKFCTLLGKDSSESFGAYFFAKHALSTQHSTAMSGVCEKIQVLPNVVNKGVQGVYGALCFLSVSSGGSEPGSEGQEGSANTLFHTVEPIRMSCRLILKPSSNPKETSSVKVHELDASSFLSFAVN